MTVKSVRRHAYLMLFQTFITSLFLGWLIMLGVSLVPVSGVASHAEFTMSRQATRSRADSWFPQNTSNSAIHEGSGLNDAQAASVALHGFDYSEPKKARSFKNILIHTDLTGELRATLALVMFLLFAGFLLSAQIGQARLQQQHSRPEPLFKKLLLASNLEVRGPPQKQVP